MWGLRLPHTDGGDADSLTVCLRCRPKNLLFSVMIRYFHSFLFWTNCDATRVFFHEFLPNSCVPGCLKDSSSFANALVSIAQHFVRSLTGHQHAFRHPSRRLLVVRDALQMLIMSDQTAVFKKKHGLFDA